MAGYNCNSFYLLDQPSFLQAECAVNGVIAAATGVSGFEAAVLSERKQKVQRYSYQRTFVESYNLTSGCFDWRTDPESHLPETQIEILPEKQLIARGILYWMFSDCWPANSGALIDYYANPKAGYYAFKQTARPVTVSINEENGIFKLYGLNDSLTEAKIKATLFVQDMHKAEPLWKTELSFSVPENSSCVVWQGKIPLPETEAVLLCDAETQDGLYRAVYFPKRVSDLGLPSASGEIPVRITEQTSSHIVLEASAYAHSVALDGDYVFSYNFFIMLPGEKRTVLFEKTYNARSDKITLNVL